MLHELWKKAQARRDPDGRRFGMISYVDLLGFSSIAWSLSATELRDKLRYSLNYKRSASQHLGSGSPPREFVKFQDTMIRCTEIGWAEEAESRTPDHLAKRYVAILDEVASLRDIQLNLAGEGILLRGAVILGSYDIVEGAVFGPALLRAHEGEKSVARYPRIILDENIAGFIDEASPSTHWFQLNVVKDHEGVAWIDYLRGPAFEAPWDLYSYAEALERHKLSLDRLCRDRPTDAQVRAKLAWLVDYHNRTVKQLSSTAPRAWELDWPTFRCTLAWEP